jgi:hypothetical protein
MFYCLEVLQKKNLRASDFVTVVSIVRKASPSEGTNVSKSTYYIKKNKVYT